MDDNKYTDEQLKRALAKMLPEKLIYVTEKDGGFEALHWRENQSNDPAICLANEVLDTELLYLCDLLEQSLDEQQELKYDPKLYDLCYYKGIPQYRAPWQDRVIAAAEARNIIID